VDVYATEIVFIIGLSDCEYEKEDREVVINGFILLYPDPSHYLPRRSFQWNATCPLCCLHPDLRHRGLYIPIVHLREGNQLEAWLRGVEVVVAPELKEEPFSVSRSLALFTSPFFPVERNLPIMLFTSRPATNRDSFYNRFV
jgi:hypothetical protein